MERDILEGREHMNLSQWDTYSADQQQTLAAKIVQETKLHNMPLLQYRMIHWDARITNADVRVFSEWAHGSSAPAGPIAQATADSDPVHGAALFEKRCTGCHSLTTSREGPRLQGVYGRSTGSVASFPTPTRSERRTSHGMIRRWENGSPTPTPSSPATIWTSSSPNLRNARISSHTSSKVLANESATESVIARRLGQPTVDAVQISSTWYKVRGCGSSPDLP
jgi:mono/diheme cytochrome c family protein